MKLSKTDIMILTNFATINDSAKFVAGRQQMTVNSVLAVGTLDEAFPCDFSVHKLSQFLSILTLFNDPELEFHDTYVRIFDNNNSSEYYFTSPDVIKMQLPKNIPDDENPSVAFSLPLDRFKNLLKASSLYDTSRMRLVTENGIVKIIIMAASRSNLAMEIGKATDINFDLHISTDHLNLMLKDDYDLLLWDNKKIINMKSTKSPIHYWIPLQKESKFGE